ncbi:MAG: hypothetical protein E6I32_07955 [Chloroflexi bacterium]|nr:MAG: hypothetical protein E6I32_07955 [Chloroflexota bacterium]
MKLFIKFIFILSMLHFGSALNSQPQFRLPAGGVSLNRIRVGFSINTVARVDNAANLGINTAFNYNTPFTPSDPVGAEMQAKGMHEVDAGFASELFYYECHRTHSVAPPPAGTPNTFCVTDYNPSINSETALLAAVDAKLQADAANPLIVGYWISDDWNLWDAGSARTVLQDIHTHILQHTPRRPAICGFGVDVMPPGVSAWDPRISLNYSNAACDMVGIYAYPAAAPTYSNGSQLDYTMSAPLAAVFKSLKSLGWNSSVTPLIGIGQAFAGSYAGTSYEPGINRFQMVAQATAFCKAGAVSIGWYAWEDSGFDSSALTPMTSADVQYGVVDGIAACQAMWGARIPWHPTQKHG